MLYQDLYCCDSVKQNVHIMQCVASNICHELVNHFSVIKFLQSDIMEEDGATISDLFDRFDLLFLYIDFFRSIFTSTDSANDALKIAVEICKLKKVNVNNCVSTDAATEKIIAIFLFILAKSARSNVTVFFRENEQTIKIIAENYTGGIPQTDINTINSTQQEIDAYNVIAYYALILAKEKELNLQMDVDSNTLVIQIWKKD